MTVKIGTVRVERNRAIQGQKQMRLTNRLLRDMLKRIYEAEFGYGAWPTQAEIEQLLKD